MKETIRQKLERSLSRMIKRRNQLQKHIDEYKADDDFENAMKCDIKKNTFDLVIGDLRNILK